MQTAQENATGVFVGVQYDEDGSARTTIAPVGVKVTEVETILGLALAGWRQHAGLANDV